MIQHFQPEFTECFTTFEVSFKHGHSFGDQLCGMKVMFVTKEAS